MSSPVQGSYPVQPPKKKIHPIVWILIGLAGCVMLVILAIVAGGIYVASRVAENPVEAAAAVIAAGNPDVEVVASNKEKGIVTFREKSTGKTVTLHLDQLKGGKVTFSGEEDGKEVRVEAGPDGVKVKSTDGKEVEISAKPQ
jgi:hypothetical protein